MKVTKEQGLHITLAGVVAFLPLLPIMWFIGKPVISTALAEDIKSAAQQQAQPIKNAFVALLVRDINATRKEIAALKFRQRQDTDWTVDGAEYLADLEIELEALREAKVALEVENTS